MGHAMLDQERGVAMLLVPHQKGAGNIHRRAFAVKTGVDLIAGEPSACRELEAVVARVPLQPDEAGGKMSRVRMFDLELHVIEGGIVGNERLGHGAAQGSCRSKTCVTLQEIEAG